MTDAPISRANAYRRDTCQSVSGTRRADSVRRAAMSSGNSVPSCGSETNSGVEPGCSVYVSMRRFYATATEFFLVPQPGNGIHFHQNGILLWISGELSRGTAARTSRVDPAPQSGDG